MKTIVIWDSCGEEGIKFCILEGNHYQLNNLYINDANLPDDSASILEETFLNEYGTFKREIIWLPEFPREVMLQDLCKVIVCGILP